MRARGLALKKVTSGVNTEGKAGTSAQLPQGADRPGAVAGANATLGTGIVFTT